MSYEWCQRLGDIRLLEWENYDLDTGILVLDQSKRGEQVTLPTSPSLQVMLKKQHEDFGFQKWIAPRPRPVMSLYQPYTMRGLSFTGKVIRQEAGLPSTLQLRDMRRTGTTEMVDAGVDLGRRRIAPIQLQVLAVAGPTAMVRKNHATRARTRARRSPRRPGR